MSDLLARATSALRESSAVSDEVDEAAVARLERDLADGVLGRATHALRATTADAFDGDDTLARIEEARATSALREETHVDRAPADEVDVARLERALTRRRRSRLSRWVALPIAAVLVVMVGWASASGRLAKWIALATHSEEERTEHERTAPPPVVPTNKPVSAAPPPTASLPPLPEEEPEPVTSASAMPSAIAVVPSAKPAGPDVDALYRAAHDAHFAKKDPATALAAWDRYLAAAPRGRFALEARYNRAITLVRLGRKTEAAAALRPFADGDYGGYRKEEARELLQSLE